MSGARTMLVLLGATVAALALLSLGFVIARPKCGVPRRGECVKWEQVPVMTGDGQMTVMEQCHAWIALPPIPCADGGK